MRKTTVLVILDGWGMAPESAGNAITTANPTCFNKLWNTYPHALLKSWGNAVGLFETMAGNSEVGHLTIGAGRIIEQRAVTISKEIQSGAFEQRSEWIKIEQITKSKTVHLIGLLSKTATHAYEEHLFALYDHFAARGYTINLHLFTDGRDAGIHDGLHLLEKLPSRIYNAIATLCGRYYGMDRNNNWDRTQKAYELIMHAQGNCAPSPIEAMRASYDDGVTDEFVKPVVIGDYQGADRQSLFFFFNFREDRLRQLARAFCMPHCPARMNEIEKSPVATLVEFEDAELTQQSAHLYKKLRIESTLADQIAAAGLTQLHVAENEKYAHVTYFFNGGLEKPHRGEQFIVVPSLQVESYDQAPEMSAQAITDTVLQNIGKIDFIVVNYANADMVAHTGDFDATVQAIKYLDEQLQKLVDAVQANNGTLIITSDHGNAEVMRDAMTGEIDTKHNNNPSPLIVISNQQLNIESAQDLTAIMSLVKQSLGLEH